MKFQSHTKVILNTANQKVSALTRVTPLITRNKKVIRGLFIYSQILGCSWAVYRKIEKQLSRGVPSRCAPRKWCSENMQQIYRTTHIPKCDFNKVALQVTLRHGCSPVYLLYIFRTPFRENTTGGLLLQTDFIKEDWKYY